MKKILIAITTILLFTSTATYAGGGGKNKPPQAYSASVPWYVVWLGW